MMTTEINKPARPVTAFDRQQILEDAARVMHNTAGQWPWERLSTEEPLWAEGWRDNAKAALPVIVAAVLKPIRELHRPHPYADAELRSVSPSLPEFVCTHCATPSGRAVAFPCPTVRLLDQIETDCKGGE